LIVLEKVCFNSSCHRQQNRTYEAGSFEELDFMKLSSEWLNTLPYIERYSFFFEHNYPAVTTPGVLSELGAYWKSLPSTKAFSSNIFGDAILIR